MKMEFPNMSEGQTPKAQIDQNLSQKSKWQKPEVQELVVAGTATGCIFDLESNAGLLLS